MDFDMMFFDMMVFDMKVFEITVFDPLKTYPTSQNFHQPSPNPFIFSMSK
jgi:hypothetical protein